ncbi:MAG TPA: glutaredoxin family protein [Solirubrobacteraceae bacterium]|nr:glutaredoxin family protein [Solirubrobacteraceae bacterium]
MTEVTVYTRPGCHLCDDALAVVMRVRETHPFTLSTVDIESDAGLLMRYLERIPVVLVEGAERFEYFVDEDEFTRAVANVVTPEHRPAT